MKKIALFVSMMTMALWGNAQSWTQQTSGVTTPLSDVFFINDSVGWITTIGKVLKTTNAGSTWTAYGSSSGISSTAQLTSVAFSTENIGWVAGAFGVIYKTIDGGLNWTAQSSGTNHNLNSLSFVNDSTGWIVGSLGTAPNPITAVILKTTDGGLTWDSLSAPANVDLNAVQFLDENLGWVAGGNLVLRTVDGGLNWTSSNTPTQLLYDVYFASPSKGWAVGQNGFMAVTADSGTTWTSQNSNANNNALFAIQFISATEGWIVGGGAIGQGPAIRYTNNEGGFWSVSSSGVTVTSVLYGVYFVSSNKGWAVGSNGRIFTFNPSVSTVVSQENFPVSIYPNPIKNIANIEFESFGTYELKVLDISGKLIFSEELTAQNHQINTESLPTGIYQISITNEKGLMTCKTILKQ
jgi:photosystem II stability/assembly factor-like uncharacterized protein